VLTAASDWWPRACQFAFERALVVDLFEELRHAQLLVFHQLEADVAAFRQALRGQFEAHVMDLVGRHQNCRSALGKLVLDRHLVERGGDGAAVAVGEVGKQDTVFRLLAPHPHRRHDGQHDRRADAEHDVAPERGLKERLLAGWVEDQVFRCCCHVDFRERHAQCVNFFPRLGQGLGLNHNYGGAARESIVETERGLVPCSTGIGPGAVLF
jgi:hypothetical protein